MPLELIERTRLFSLAVLRFCRALPRSDEAQEAARQLRKAANSVRSNYRSARKGRSRAEFQSKLQIAFEEADECVDWLEYFRDGGIQADAALLDEASQLSKILGKAVHTARDNTNKLEGRRSKFEVSSKFEVGKDVKKPT